MWLTSKKVRIKGNTKPWFDSEVISIVNKRGACYKKFKSPGLETDKDILRATKEFLKNTIQKKKKIFFMEIMENPEIFRTKTLKKTSQSKICLIGDKIIQFENKKMLILLKFLFWVGRVLIQKTNETSSQI